MEDPSALFDFGEGGGGGFFASAPPLTSAATSTMSAVSGLYSPSAPPLLSPYEEEGSGGGRGRRRRGRYHSEELTPVAVQSLQTATSTMSTTPPASSFMPEGAQGVGEGEGGEEGDRKVRRAGRRRKRDDYAEALHAYPRQYSAFPKLPSEMDNPHELPPSHNHSAQHAQQHAHHSRTHRQRSE